MMDQHEDERFHAIIVPIQVNTNYIKNKIFIVLVSILLTVLGVFGLVGKPNP
jgi:hypothetical protein